MVVSDRLKQHETIKLFQSIFSFKTLVGKRLFEIHIIK